MKTRSAAASAQTSLLGSSRRPAAAPNAPGRASVDADTSRRSDSECLSPLVDRLGDALLEPLGLVSVELDLGERLAAWRLHVRAQRVVERLRERLRVLLGVDEVQEQ